MVDRKYIGMRRNTIFLPTADARSPVRRNNFIPFFVRNFSLIVGCKICFCPADARSPVHLRYIWRFVNNV